jgi:hypothetical protein
VLFTSRAEIEFSRAHFLGSLLHFISDLAQSHPEINVVLNEMAPRGGH